MTFHLIRKDGRYGVRTPDGTDTYTDGHGRPYTKRSATHDVARYRTAGQPKPPKLRYCPSCRRSLDSKAILPCMCPKA